MKGFLARMARESGARARRAAACEPPAALRARARDASPAPGLRLDRGFGLIAEYKQRSPALGRLSSGDDNLAGRVAAYAHGGALAVSILTEPAHFDGSLGHLATAARLLAPLGVPVMRKDFLVDPYQLFEARAAGAGGALLIVRMLSDARLGELLACARELALFVLLECFDAEDIARAAACGTQPRVLVGVNCRDLETLAIRPRRFRELAALLPPDLPRVAESGIGSPEDCAAAARSGYGFALVGGCLMSANDPAGMVRSLVTAGRAAAREAA